MPAYAVNVGVNLKVTSASVAPVINSLQKQLQSKSINIPVKINFQKISSKDLITYNTQFRNLSNTLHTLSVNANASAKSINSLHNSLAGVQRNLSGIGGNGSGLANLPKQTNAASKNVMALNNALKSSNVQVTTFAENIAVTTKRFAAFTVGATILYSITSAFYDAGKAALEFDREMVRFKQVSGDTPKVISGISKEISRLSVELGTSSADLAKSAVTLRQAGLSASATKTALEALAKTTLSSSFDDLNSTTEGVIAIMSQFKGTAGGLEGQLSSLSKVSAEYAVESRDLVEAIKRTGGAFAASGGNLNELLGLFTSIRATTRESAESIATGMRTILGRLEDPTIAKKIKQNFNIDLYDKGQFVGYYEAIRKLSEVINSLPAGNIKISELIRDIGGLRNLSRVIPLLTQFPMAEQVKKAAESSEGKLEKDAMIAQEALLTQVTRVKEGFLDLFRTISQDTSVRTVLGGIASFLTGISQTLKSIQPLVPVLLALATVGTARYIGRNVGAIQSGFSTGRYGATLPKYSSGGPIPGVGSSDTVPIMATPGEFILNKEAAQAIGYHNLKRFNKKTNRYSIESLIEAQNTQKGYVENRVFGLTSNHEFTSGSPQSYANALINTHKQDLRNILKIGRLEKLGITPSRYGLANFSSLVRKRVKGYAEGGIISPYPTSLFDTGYLSPGEKRRKKARDYFINPANITQAPYVPNNLNRTRLEARQQFATIPEASYLGEELPYESDTYKLRERMVRYKMQPFNTPFSDQDRRTSNVPFLEKMAIPGQSLQARKSITPGNGEYSIATKRTNPDFQGRQYFGISNISKEGNKFVESLKKLDSQKSIIRRTFESLSKTYESASIQVGKLANRRLNLSSFKGVSKVGLGAAAIAAPYLIESVLGTSIKQPGSHGIGGARVGSALTGAITSGGIGALTGSTFGPIGTTIGGLGGAVLGAIGALKSFDEELQQVHLQEFNQIISKVQFTDTGQFKTEGDRNLYNQGLSKVIPDLKQLREKEFAEVGAAGSKSHTYAERFIENRYANRTLTAAYERNKLTSPEALISQYASDEQKETISSQAFQRYQSFAKANPKLSRNEINKALGTNNIGGAQLNITQQIRLGKDGAQQLENFDAQLKKSTSLQAKLVGIQEQAVNAYEQISQSLELYHQNIEESSKQFNIRGEYSQLGSRALQGQITAAPSNLSTNNLGEPFKNLHNFAKQGGQYDQARQFLIASIGKHGREAQEGSENSLSAAEKINDEFKRQDFGPHTALIQKQLAHVLGSQTNLGQSVKAGGAIGLTDQILAPLKGFKEANTETNKQLNDKFQATQQQHIEQLNRQYALRQQNAENIQQQSQVQGQLRGVQAGLSPSQRETIAISRFRGGRFSPRGTVSRFTTAEERSLKSETGANIYGFEAGRTALTGLPIGSSAKDVVSNIQVEQEKVRALSAQKNQLENNGAPIEKISALGKEISNSQDKIRTFSADLKSLADSTVYLEGAQKKFALAVDQYQADLESRKRDADTLAFGSKQERMSVLQRENLTQNVLQNFSAEQFAQLPDAIRKIVGDRLKETEGMQRSVESFDKYGRSSGFTSFNGSQALDYLRSPFIRQGGNNPATNQLRNNVQNTGRGVQTALDEKANAQKLLGQVNLQDIQKTSQEMTKNFSQYLTDIDASIAAQMEATQKFLNGSSELVTALNGFPRSIELTRNGTVEVIINGGQLIAAAKGDIEKSVITNIIDKLREVIKQEVKNQPVR